MILGIRTDKPEAELYLCDESGEIVDSYIWYAHKELSDSLLLKMKEMLATNKVPLEQIAKIVAYSGPGSFTGLRIGISVANALAYGMDVPITASTGTDWMRNAVMQKTTTSAFVVPSYGLEPHITQQKK